MTQSRTHNCNELRLSNAGEKVTLVGWYENLRKVSKNLGFLILRDFYGTTQIVVETEEMMEKLDGVNKESTISVTGTVRERSNKNTELPTGEIEVVPEGIEILGKCIYNALPFEINQSREADENTRLKYRYLDLRNPSVKSKIVLRSRIVAELRNKMNELGFLELFSGRRERLSGTGQKSSGQVLCTAAGTAAVQADFNGVRIRPLFPDCTVFP